MSFTNENAGESTAARPLCIIFDDRSFAVDVADLHRLAARLYTTEQIPSRQRTSLIFCSNACIRKLNNKYRHIDRATDVLSFCFSEPDLLGEIYISLPRAARQAKEYRGSLADELRRLLVHGFFHLLGYDHATSAQRKVMREKERRYIE